MSDEPVEVLDVLAETRNARAALIFEGFTLFQVAIGVLTEITNQIEALKPKPAETEATSDDPQVASAPAATVDPAPAAPADGSDATTS